MDVRDIKDDPLILEKLGVPPQTVAAADMLLWAHAAGASAALFAIDRFGNTSSLLATQPSLEDRTQIALVLRALVRTRFPILRTMVTESDTATAHFLLSCGWREDGTWRHFAQRPDGAWEDGRLFTFLEEVDNGHVRYVQRFGRDTTQQNQEHDGADLEPLQPGVADPVGPLSVDADAEFTGLHLRQFSPDGDPADDAAYTLPARKPGFTWRFGCTGSAGGEPDSFEL